MAGPTRVAERDLRYVVTCPTCGGITLGRCASQAIADDVVTHHRRSRGHTAKVGR